MLNAQVIKEQLNIENIISIIESLDGEYVKSSGKDYIFSSICHHIDAQNHSKKLYYYIESSLFKCYSCGFSGDIIALIQERWDLQGKDYVFLDVLNYIIDIADLDIKKIQTIPKEKKFDWGFLDKFSKIKNGELEIKTYDDNILKFFPKLYHESFINDNISINTMNKYGLRYYPFRQQTIIPVYDKEHRFVGIHCRNHIKDIVDLGYKYQPCKLLNGDEYNFPTSMILYGLDKNKDNIIKSKTVLIFEAPKSVLQMEEILKHNNSVALFGTNLSKYKRNTLFKLGVINYVICLDKQYIKWYNNDIDEDVEFKRWKYNINKIINDLKGYGNISIVYDKNELLDHKDSPSDKGRDVWNKLWNKREIIS